jgi:hypothetical protein
MPARTLNDFFAGFFYAGIRARQEVGMVITYIKVKGMVM